MRREDQTIAALVDGLLEDQRRRWRAGERVGAESYFAQHPELLAEAQDALQLLYNEMILREEIGDAAHLDEYLRRFPQFAEQLPRLLEVHQALESGRLFDSTALEASLHLATPMNGFRRAFDIDSRRSAAMASGWPRVAGYEILGELGRGGMGIVYKARQAGLNRIVALKMIVVGCHADAALLARFRGEAEVLARLEHPNIVKIHEIGEQEGRPYISLEFVDGGSLAQRLDAVPQPPRPAARFLEKLARAAHAAHQQGIIHRDLKPANILLQKDGDSPLAHLNLQTAIPKITDFGLAKNLHVDAGQTGSGAILGTPSYMAPEQADGRGQEIGPAADVYALGSILYELLSGVPPHKGGTQLATMRLLLSEEPVSLSRLHLPTDLVTICCKCLRKDPRRRYATALDLADDLERFLGDRPIQARRVGRLEQAWLWARRNPLPAGLTTAVVLLLLLVAVVSTVSSVWLRQALAESENHRLDVEQAHANAKAKLWIAYLDEAKALRSSRKPGQRVAGLEAIRAALRLPVPADRSRAELRTEAIACLLLPDIELAREWDGWPAGATGFAIDEAFARYARGNKDGSVSVRQVADDKELYRLPSIGVLDSWSLSFAPDGQFLHHRSDRPGRPRSRIWKLDGPNAEVVLDDDAWLVFRPDGRQFAAARRDGSIRLFETATGTELRRFQTDLPIRNLAWNPKFPKMALVSSLDTRILDLESGAISAPMPPAGHHLAWHPNGRILARVDGLQIQLWDTATGCLHMPPFVGHKSEGIQLKFDPAGDQLLSTDWSGIWRLWDVRTGNQLLTIPMNSQDIFFSRDHKLVAVQLLAPKIRLFRVYPGTEVRSLAHYVGAQPSRFRAVSAVKADGRLLAVDVTEGVALIDIARAEELAVLPIPVNYPLRFAAAGNALWTSGNRGLLRWPFEVDAVTGAITVGPSETLGAHAGGENWGASADGQVIAITIPQGALLWQRAADRLIPLGPQEDVRSCAVSPDGRWVATGSHDARQGAGAKIWDAATGKPIADLPVGPFCSVGFSPDGRRLVTTGGGPRLWTVGTWQEAAKLGPSAFGHGFTFSTDSKLLAVGGEPGVVRLLMTDTGQEIARLTVAEQTRLWPQCFTPDDTQLVAIGMESSALHLFDLRAIRRQLAELGLDWDQPAYPAATPADLAPLQIQIVPSKKTKK